MLYINLWRLSGGFDLKSLFTCRGHHRSKSLRIGGIQQSSDVCFGVELVSDDLDIQVGIKVRLRVRI